MEEERIDLFAGGGWEVLMTRYTPEEFKAYCEKEDAKNTARQTDPPTQKIGIGIESGDGKVHYDDGTHVQWVCPCGTTRFDVFYIEGHYETYVRCPQCGKQDSVHTG